MSTAGRSLRTWLLTARGERSPAEERRARLVLSIVLTTLGLVVVALLAIPVQYRLAGSDEERALVLRVYTALDGGMLAILLAVYAVGKLGHTRTASVMLAGIAMSVSYLSVLATGQELGLVTLGLGPLMAGILLSRRATLVISIVATGAMLTLPIVTPGLDYAEVVSSLLVMLTLGGLSVVSAAMHDRDLRQIEQQSLRIAADAERLAGARKMEAIARLASGVAHEFNNIMAGVMGYAEAIDARPTDAAVFARRIRDAARRASRQTEHLLSFSRQQLLRPQPLSLNDLVSRLGARLGRHVRVVLEPETSATVVDAALLERALETLVARAARQAGPRGTVTIRTTERYLGSDESSLAPGFYRVVKVSDDGPPLNPEILHRVFDPFYTTGEFGTGDLELAAAYGIIGQSGGHLGAEHPIEGGNCFVVHLPTTPGAS